eukprot:TRINITY_DN3340_c0_g1_i1.p1 TRINITY_DN3340_c0_g1~~TRINITY_DN3340_c0_g1_i1.p1  ORF type:complete len:273 (+),score=52.82 TRINITY_DN3340_c0_g1_i1:58-876(+)
MGQTSSLSSSLLSSSSCACDRVSHPPAPVSTPFTELHSLCSAQDSAGGSESASVSSSSLSSSTLDLPVPSSPATSFDPDKAWAERGLLLRYRLCMRNRETILEKYPQIPFLLRAMGERGCPVSSSFIQCRPCRSPEELGRFDFDDEGKIARVVMCQNSLKANDEEEMATAITHELIHAYDHCRANYDPSNLEQHACTEIRAAMLSGECASHLEKRRGFTTFARHAEDCIKRRAINSVRKNPKCTGQEQATYAVEKVFNVCKKDTEPFGVVPW